MQLTKLGAIFEFNSNSVMANKRNANISKKVRIFANL